MIIPKVFCFSMLVLLTPSVGAELDDFPFQSGEQAQRFKQLVKELRCLVCQNQSLADSNAALAQDLRTELYQQILRGHSDDQIIMFMTKRYGDFILYRPRFNVGTLFLWLAPLLFLMAGIAGLFRFARKPQPPITQPTEAELQAIRNLLDLR